MKKILFLCPHHAAKSVLAEAYFNHIMQNSGFTATSAGTEPDEAVSPAVANLLLGEGMDVRNHRPRQVTADELSEAGRIISMGCSPEGLGLPADKIEMWHDVPPVSQDIYAAREAILKHVWQLVDELRTKDRQ
jgi:protein-tyrosine-phosphatase